MIRIGLVGEDPNDTSSIANLLNNKYEQSVQFFPLIKMETGYQLDNVKKIKRKLPKEFNDKRCSFIIYIRDVDDFKTNKAKINKLYGWFKDLDSTVNNKGILLLNIWELEALILADIATFNKLYKVSHQYPGDPMVQKEPKEELMRITAHCNKNYKESHCPEIFEQLNFDNVEKNCTYFRDFIIEFDKKLKPKRKK